MAPQLPPLLPPKLLSLADRLQTGQKLLWPSSALATLGARGSATSPRAMQDQRHGAGIA
jgi:hypothetical protein